MPQDVCLMVLIGLPAAGKTTFCRWLLNTSQSKFNIIHICYDNFLDFHQFHSHQEPSKLHSDYKARRTEIFKIIQTIANSLVNSKEIPMDILQKIQISDKRTSSGGYLILCDDNHYYRSMRYKMFQLCKSQSYAYAQIYFECDKQLALNRNSQRKLSSRLPEHIVLQMAARLEVPMTSNIWENSTLTIDANSLNFSIDSVMLLILRSFEEASKTENANKIAKFKAKDEKTSSSSIHALDILLRRRITEMLEMEQGKDSKRSKAMQLNARRKTILQKCRALEQLDESNFDIYLGLLNRN